MAYATIGMLGGAASAQAVSAAAWSIDSVAYPSDFSTADNARCEANPGIFVCETYAVTATNVGAKPTGSGTVVITDTVPPGLTVRKVSLFYEVKEHETTDLGSKCTTSPVKCVVPIVNLGQPIRPDQALKMYVSVTVDTPAAAGALVNAATVSGGGGGITPSSVSADNTVESGHPGFGVELFNAPLYDEAGLAERQAGGHPYELDTRIAPTTVFREDPEGDEKATSVEDVRDVIVDLPPGLAGSGVSAPQCTLTRLGSKGSKEEQGKSGCPEDTVIGHIRTYPVSNVSANSPIYNLTPEKGTAAELGFLDATGGTHVLYVSLAPTPAGYVVRTTGKEIPQLGLTEIIANVFGDPAVRDVEASEPAPPTFTNPSDCNGEPLRTTILMDSWQHPGSYNADGSPNLSDSHWASASYQTSPPVTFCSALAGLFAPSLTATPTSKRANSPTGLDVTLTIPQHTGAEELATPPLRDTTITLPPGVRVNPSSANGLEACSLEQIGISATGVPNAAPPSCPDGSKLGTVEVETPALAMKVCKNPALPVQECPESEREATALHGSIYLARQAENPFKSLLAIYIAVDDPRTGVIVKLPAEVKADTVTGQLTTTVLDTPQFPFSQLRTHFFSGDTASLDTPPECGTFAVQTQLRPWSAPESGPPATPSSSFEVDEGASGGGCGPLGFAPSFSAGTVNPLGGAYSPLSVTFSRQDVEQEFGGATVTTPPGLLGTIRGIPRCPEPRASAGDCSPASAIGEASTAVGAGPTPYWVRGGQVYLTGPYNGGPFGLSIVVPTTAGPFTLTGNGGPGREVVRASIRVDPHTGQITVVSDPFPTILEGIPLQIRSVHVAINRPNFTFNPTNCSQLTTTAAFSSVRGATATASRPFFASDCARLAFQPTLTATAAAVTSRPDGASLTISVTSRTGDANVAKTDLQFPSSLPSRQSTLKHACLAKQFEANPAGCPPESNIGTAAVTTPVLSSPLSGPIYLVSFGNAAFPDAEIVLQGEGVTTILDGKTDIKHSVTYSNFETVPDVPFTSFTASLPAGPHSILGAYLPETAGESLCGLTIAIPTRLVAQNGRQVTQLTPVRVAGCPTRLTLRAKRLSSRRHRRLLTLTFYTPSNGTLRVRGKGVKQQHATAHAGRLQTITLTIAQHAPRHSTLAVSLTSGGRSYSTRVRVSL
ncbi:MAG: hypothetical protein ACYDCQ_03015 [Dehalococcoidia bacterium]